MRTKDLKNLHVNHQKYCELNVIFTVWIYHGSMLDTFPSFVHGIHMHPTIPGTMTTGPGEIRALSTDFQTLSPVILQVYQRRHKPSHKLEIIIIVKTAFLLIATICKLLNFTSKAKEIPRCAANAYCS